MKILLYIALGMSLVGFSNVKAIELSKANLVETGAGFNLLLELSSVSNIEISSHDLEGSAEQKINPRFYVDMKPVKLSKKFQPPAFLPDSKILRARWAQYQKDVVRVVFDLKTNEKIPFNIEKKLKGILISTGEIIEKNPSEKTPEKIEEKPIEKIPESTVKIEKVVEVKTEVPNPELVKLKVEKNEPVQVMQKSTDVKVKKKFRIILDAGHGGEDSGAVGKKGVMEKNVTLAIVKKIQNILEKNKRYEIFMTREKDETLKLLDRTKFANEKNGDLFVSIHANASPKTSSKGISTYFLNNADDQESLRVAMRENGELDPDVLHQKSKNTDEYYLEVMKASMEKNFHTTRSTDLAQNVQRDLLRNLKKKYSEVVDLGVRSARFYVLTGATMPAILVETSFISNPEEEKRLSDSRYQTSLAQAVVNGIEAYFKNSPPLEDHRDLASSAK